MQHTQLNVVKPVAQALGLLVLMAVPALAGTIAKPHQPDPLLDGGPTTACATSPDYAAGTDVRGGRVAPADVAAAAVPVPDSIAVPLAQAGPRGRVRPGMGDSSYVSLDGRKLAPLLNPPPCR
jgi:hypothetical protein